MLLLRGYLLLIYSIIDLLIILTVINGFPKVFVKLKRLYVLINDKQPYNNYEHILIFI